MVNLALAKHECDRTFSELGDLEFAKFKRYEFSLKHFILANKYVEPRLSMAIGYLYYLTDLTKQNSSKADLSLQVFESLQDGQQLHGLRMFEIARSALSNVSATVNGGDWNLDILERIAWTSFDYESRPILLSLVSELIGYGQAEKANSKQINEIPSTAELAGQERLVLKILMAGTQQKLDLNFSVMPKCQADRCIESGRKPHTALWAIYCPTCGDVEIFCEQAREHLHFSSLALPMNFSKSCRHLIFDSRDCRVDPIASTFANSAWEEYLYFKS